MTRRQYPNPPIEEAVCEFRFAPDPAWNLTIPGLFYEKIKDFYTGEPQIEPSPSYTNKGTFRKVAEKLARLATERIKKEDWEIKPQDLQT
ncbi:hypothetical protein HUN01_24125 [Nostoc edaphicum CCNP1411]|uniref:Uncharacterized protein n=1 Tax=Nostoc edaphicum CCNP1411 TaxID=1472755 RepID=A0A7D7LD51_9NOSO|nr:hypothetical protein [Nostoc edaphicum]QMS90513.1 hypothetical protein HUN01_24125 [Nostoc edaphicum CCNP1411]